MEHESRLTLALRSLLLEHRVAALATVGEDGAPFVSMAPYALAPELGSLVIYVSALAAHTRNLQHKSAVSLMVMQAECSGEPVHALPRVTFEVSAQFLAAQDEEWRQCRAAYLTRFPESATMTQLGDFSFVRLQLLGARHVAGFGAARSIEADEVRRILNLEAAPAS